MSDSHTRRHSRSWPAVLALGALTVVAASCGSNDSGSVGVFVSGSSTVEPISTRVAELFEDVDPNAYVSVDGPGTGDGFKLFCEGETDISGASRPIKEAEVATCVENGVGYVELRVGIDGIAVLTSADNPIDCLSFVDLYALFGPESQGLGNWTDAQALATSLGSATEFPDAALDLSAPGTESGTYDSFIEIALEDTMDSRVEAHVLPDERNSFQLRADYPSSGDDNTIISTIAGSASGLGFVGFAFAEQAGEGVKLVAIDGGNGCVDPTVETIASGEYPISRSLYIYPNIAKAAANPALTAYVDFYLSDEGLSAGVVDVDYVELGDAAKKATRAAWADRS